MKIAGLQKASFIDYSGKASLVIFTAGCNFKCGYCYNSQIKDAKEFIDEKEIWNYVDKINKVKKLIDAIVICGGEPTLQNDLPEFAKRAKEKNLLVKLDTNGSNPEMLKNLLEKKLIDYIAMDIKGPLYLYPKIIGGEMNSKNVKESMRIITKFPDYEFRTTIVPIISKDNKTRWISPSEIKDAAELIYYCTEEKRGHKYLLQKFTACEKGEMIDENFSRKVLQSEFWETPNKIIEECVKEAKKWLPNTTAREKL